MDMRFIYIELFKVAVKPFIKYVYSTLRSLFVSFFLFSLSLSAYLPSFEGQILRILQPPVCSASTKNSYSSCVSNALLVLLLAIANNIDAQ